MKTSGVVLNRNLVMLSLTPNLHHFFVDNGIRYQAFSFSEKVISTLFEIGILDGVKSEKEPEAPRHLSMWLRPAIDIGIPNIKESELLVWDAVTGKWVEPTKDVMVQALKVCCSPSPAGFNEGDLLGYKVVDGKLTLVKLNAIASNKTSELV